MELKGVRGALTRANQMEHGVRPASPHGVRPAFLPPNFTLAAALTSLQRQQVRQEQQQHHHTPHQSLHAAGGAVSTDVGIHHWAAGVASSDVAIHTSGSNVDMSLSRNVLLEVEDREEVQQCLIEMLQGRHQLQLQV